MAKKIEPSVEAQIISLYLSGTSWASIVEQTGISYSTVGRVLNEDKTIKRNKRQYKRYDFTDADIEEMKKMYREGMTYNAIAEKFGMTNASSAQAYVRRKVRAWEFKAENKIELVKSGREGQLCWYCAKAVGKCSWSRNFVPVEGWKAVPVDRGFSNTFDIRDCPEFVEG